MRVGVRVAIATVVAVGIGIGAGAASVGAGSARSPVAARGATRDAPRDGGTAVAVVTPRCVVVPEDLAHLQATSDAVLRRPVSPAVPIVGNRGCGAAADAAV
ncbi:MAG TPA: hypothetical protein VFC99_06625 [Acidimicrobiia bacterium]|nr:hypothetical protein [Acidimicrobiia bacterium]